MGDPIAILLIAVLIAAAVAVWMIDSTYRARLTKTSKRAGEAETKAADLDKKVTELRADRDKNRQRTERLEKERDSERELVRKLRAKVKRQGKAPKTEAADAGPSADVERLEADLAALRADLARRVGTDNQLAEQVEKQTAELAERAERIAALEAQVAKAGRGVRVALVDSEVEAAREDLPTFIKRIKTEMAILERKVARNHEAFLSQQGKTAIVEDKLSAMRSRYRSVCRELAVLLSGDQELDEQEAQAVAESAMERAKEAAQWTGVDSAPMTDSEPADEPVEAPTAPELAADPAVEAAPADEPAEEAAAALADEPVAEAAEPAEKEA